MTEIWETGEFYEVTGTLSPVQGVAGHVWQLEKLSLEYASFRVYDEKGKEITVIVKYEHLKKPK